MPNLTRFEIKEQIDYERREANAKFISPDQTYKLMDRALSRLLREPGIRTRLMSQTLTASNATDRYAINEDFKEVSNLISGAGTNPFPFAYIPPDEYDMTLNQFVYTFKEAGYIRIKFPDAGSLPSSTITLNYWSKNIILDEDGVTYKRVWENDDDISALDDSYDEFYIEWPVARILRREGKKEWADRDAMATQVVDLLKESPTSKTRRTRRSFGLSR